MGLLHGKDADFEFHRQAGQGVVEIHPHIFRADLPDDAIHGLAVGQFESHLTVFDPFRFGGEVGAGQGVHQGRIRQAESVAGVELPGALVPRRQSQQQRFQAGVDFALAQAEGFRLVVRERVGDLLAKTCQPVMQGDPVARSDGTRRSWLSGAVS
jgi:hypothetical protein